MTSADTLLPCEHCGCRFGYHEAGCAALVDDIVSVAVTGFKADMECILADHSTPPTPATDDREAVARALYEAVNGSPTCYSWDDSGLDDEHPGARNRYYRQATAALSALAPIRAAEILAARTSGRNDATKAYLEGVEHGEAAGEANERARIVAWLRAHGTTEAHALANSINEHGAGK